MAAASALHSSCFSCCWPHATGVHWTPHLSISAVATSAAIVSVIHSAAAAAAAACMLGGHYYGDDNALSLTVFHHYLG